MGQWKAGGYFGEIFNSCARMTHDTGIRSLSNKRSERWARKYERKVLAGAISVAKI